MLERNDNKQFNRRTLFKINVFDLSSFNFRFQQDNSLLLCTDLVFELSRLLKLLGFLGKPELVLTFLHTIVVIHTGYWRVPYHSLPYAFAPKNVFQLTWLGTLQIWWKMRKWSWHVFLVLFFCSLVTNVIWIEFSQVRKVQRGQRIRQWCEWYNYIENLKEWGERGREHNIMF